MMYVTVYNTSFNSNCRILTAKLNYRFTLFSYNYKNRVLTCFQTRPHCWQCWVNFYFSGFYKQDLFFILINGEFAV